MKDKSFVGTNQSNINMIKYKIYKIQSHVLITRSIEFEACNVLVSGLFLEQINIEGVVSEHNTFESALLEVDKIKNMQLVGFQMTILPFISL